MFLEQNQRENINCNTGKSMFCCCFFSWERQDIGKWLIRVCPQFLLKVFWVHSFCENWQQLTNCLYFHFYSCLEAQANFPLWDHHSEQRALHQKQAHLLGIRFIWQQRDPREGISCPVLAPEFLAWCAYMDFSLNSLLFNNVSAKQTDNP